VTIGFLKRQGIKTVTHFYKISVHLFPAIFGGTDSYLVQPDAAAGNAEAP
jgi:hypothetical protein